MLVEPDLVQDDRPSLEIIAEAVQIFSFPDRDFMHVPFL
jgi:hypothetical protein